MHRRSQVALTMLLTFLRSPPPDARRRRCRVAPADGDDLQSKRRGRAGGDGHHRRPGRRRRRRRRPGREDHTRASRPSKTWRLGATASAPSSPDSRLGLLRDFRVNRGDNKHVVVLPLQSLAESVTVGRDARSGGRSGQPGVRPDRHGRADSGALGRSGRDGAPVERHRRSRRGHPRRQLRGAAAAAEVADQVDSRHARSVRRRDRAAGIDVRRRHHAARASVRSAAARTSRSATAR